MRPLEKRWEEPGGGVALSSDSFAHGYHVCFIDGHTHTGKGKEPPTVDPNPASPPHAPIADSGNCCVFSKGAGREVGAPRALAWPDVRIRTGAIPGPTTGASRRLWAAGAEGVQVVGALPGAGPGAKGRGRSLESRRGLRGPGRGARI